MKYKDDRIKMMNELLNGMKILKLYAWEPSMEKMVFVAFFLKVNLRTNKVFLFQILEIRQKEIDLLKKLSYLGAAMSLTWASAPFLVSF